MNKRLWELPFHWESEQGNHPQPPVLLLCGPQHFILCTWSSDTSAWMQGCFFACPHASMQWKSLTTTQLLPKLTRHSRAICCLKLRDVLTYKESKHNSKFQNTIPTSMTPQRNQILPSSFTDQRKVTISQFYPVFFPFVIMSYYSKNVVKSNFENTHQALMYHQAGSQVCWDSAFKVVSVKMLSEISSYMAGWRVSSHYLQLPLIWIMVGTTEGASQGRLWGWDRQQSHCCCCLQQSKWSLDWLVWRW